MARGLLPIFDPVPNLCTDLGEPGYIALVGIDPQPDDVDVVWCRDHLAHTPSEGKGAVHLDRGLPGGGIGTVVPAGPHSLVVFHHRLLILRVDVGSTTFRGGGGWEYSPHRADHLGPGVEPEQTHHALG